MKTFKLFCFYSIIALAAIPCVLHAQTELSTATGINWRLIPRWRNTSNFDVAAYNSSGSPLCEGTSTGILKLDDNNIVSNVNGSGVVRMKKDLSVQWLTDIDANPLAIGMFNGNILTVATTDASTWKGMGDHYVGYLIDAKTGKILVKKDLFDGGEDFYQQPVFLFAPDGSSFKIAVRKTAFAKGTHGMFLNMNKLADQYFTTSAFTMLEFDKDLNVKSTVSPKLEDGYFLGGTTNKNGDIFFMTDVSQGFIRIARYQPGKTGPLKTLQQAVDISDDVIKNLDNFYMFTSKDDPLVVYFACTYENVNKDYELVVAKFNFNDGTVQSSSQVMNKDYIKAIEKAFVPFNKKLNSVDLGPLKELKIKNVLENNGRLIVALSSFSTRNGYSNMGGHATSIETVVGHDLLVDIFDAKTNLQYQQVIPRFYSTPLAARLGIGMHVKNDMLYLVANNNKGLIGFKALYSQIDLKTGAITNIMGIEKTISGLYGIDPYAVLWFDDKFVLSYIEEKEWYHNSQDAQLQLLSY